MIYLFTFMLEALVKTGTSVEIAFFVCLLRHMQRAYVILSNMVHKCKIWKKDEPNISNSLFHKPMGEHVFF